MASYEDDALYENGDYTKNVSEKMQMRVPKRIKGNGEYYEDQDMDMWSHHNNANGNSNAWNYQDNFDMTVPDRIVVIGQEQHHGKNEQTLIKTHCPPPQYNHVPHSLCT